MVGRFGLNTHEGQQAMQEWRLEILLLLWLVCINGAPILLARWAGQKFNHPIDGNRLFIDGRPLLGASKTFRGLAAALCVSVVMGMLFAMPLGVSLMFGALSMAGDMTSSFIKRRLGLAPSSMALGLDQIPEALFPLLGVRCLGRARPAWPPPSTSRPIPPSPRTIANSRPRPSDTPTSRW